MKTQSMQMNKGLVAILIRKIYEESLPIEITIGKTVCVDQSIAGFDNKQYIQDVILNYKEENEKVYRDALNDSIVQFSKS